jgi:TatA/E family protein of Tat protein translocase
VFNLGFTEMAVIFVVALLVFGPNKLPELARNLGKSLAEFRRASNDLRRSIMDADAPAPPPRPPQGPADEMATAALPAAPGALPEGVPASAPVATPAAAQGPEPASGGGSGAPTT